MSKILVSLRRSQRERILQMMRRTNRKIEAVRCRIVLLLDKGRTAEVVAELVGCVRASVYRTVYRLQNAGEMGLLDGRRERGPLKATSALVNRLLGYLGDAPKDHGWQRSNWTLELLAAQLLADTGIRLSLTHLWRKLKRAGCRRGRPRPALRIPVRGRRQTLAKIEQLVARADAQEEVVYLDEADIDLNPRIGLTYIPRGQQPLVHTPGKNVKYYIAGALNARTGRVHYAHGPRKNSGLFIDMLHVLHRAYRRARVVHVVLDNYIIHKSQQTQKALAALGGHVVLHFLPPYSPEHNRIERFWKQLHDNVTRNHRHTTMQSLWQDVVEFVKIAQPFPGTKVSMNPVAV